MVPLCCPVVVLLLVLLGSLHSVSACQKLREGCSVFSKCCKGFACQPGSHKCYHKPRWEDEPCSAGFECKSDLQCEAGSQKCRSYGRAGDPCHATRKCANGFSCQPGSQKCYNSPRQEGQPCSAGYGCSSGLNCEAGTQVCRAPGGVGDACHATRPCGGGLSCQPGVHKCYDNPRKEGQPCSAGFGCASELNCEAGSQTCRRPGEVRDPCHLTRPCKDGLSCQPGIHKCYHSPRRIGEPCSAGISCAHPYFCHPLLQRCAMQKFDPEDKSVCKKLYDPILSNFAKHTKLAWTFGTALELTTQRGLSYEVGLAFGPNGEFSCYASKCDDLSFFDTGASIAVTISEVKDWKYLTTDTWSIGGTVEFFEIGFTTGVIRASEGEVIGSYHSVSVGLGVTPINVNSQTQCYTSFYSPDPNPALAPSGADATP